MNAEAYIYGSVGTRAGLATLTDITRRDIEAFVHYWHGGVADLEAMVIKPELLGAREDTFRRFEVAIRSGSPEQEHVAYAIRLDGALVGYTLLNRYSDEVNYSHWHIIEPSLRAGGISTALYPIRIKAYFDTVPIRRLIHETRTKNIGVNRMLDKYLPVVETRFTQQPDGVSGAGEFNYRYVFAEDIPGFVAKAEAMRAAAK